MKSGSCYHQSFLLADYHQLQLNYNLNQLIPMTSSTKASLSKKKQQKQQPPQQPNSFNRSSSVSSIGSNHTIKSNYTSNNSTSTSNIPANGTPNPKKRGRDGGLLSPINTSNSSSNPSSKSNSANSTPSASPTRLISSNSAIPNNLHRDADGSLLSSQESEESSSFLSQSPNPNPRKLKGIMRDKKSGGISMGVGEKKEMYERMVKGAFEGRKNVSIGLGKGGGVGKARQRWLSARC